MSNQSTPHLQASAEHSRSSSWSAASTSSPLPQSPLLELDHMQSLLAMSPPSSMSKTSVPLFQGDLVPLIDSKAAAYQGHSPTGLPFILPHLQRDAQGNRRQPGLKDMLQWLRETFRDRFIRYVIEQVSLTNVPWNNRSLTSLQHALNHVYPTHRIRLHSDDTGVIPVSFRCNSGDSIKKDLTLSRLFETLVSSETKSGMKVSPRSLNLYPPSMTNEC